MLAVLLNLGFAGGGTVAPEVSHVGGSGRILPAEWPKKKRKFTDKDEKELKKLLRKVVEDEKNAQQKLEKKAESLRNVVNAAEGIRNAVDDVQRLVRKQALAHRISWEEAQRRIEELEEEEDILLMLAL